jgi:hypothetical protein
MSEIEQLRGEIAALQERLQRLERRERAKEDAGQAELQKLKREWLESEKARGRTPHLTPMTPFYQPPQQPYWYRHGDFPPGTILC